MTAEDRFNTNYALIHYTYNKLFTDYDLYKDELIEEGVLGLWKACVSFNESYGTQFSTYAYVIIQRCMTTFVKRVIHKNSCCVSLEGIISEDGEGHEIYLIDALGEASYNAEKYRIQACMERISKRDADIINKLMQGYTQEEIAHTNHVSQATVSRCLTRFKNIYMEELRNENN